MADDKYNSQKHRFQYIERIRKRRRRRVWLRILVGSIQQRVQNGHPRWLHSLITTRRCFLSRVPHRSPAARPQGLAKVVTTPGLIPVDILKSVSDGYSIIRLAASPPTSNYGKGRISILRLAGFYLRTRQPDVRCWVSHGGGSVPSSIPTPAVHHPSLVWDANRAGMDQLLTPEFWKIQIEVARADSRGAKPACALT